MVTDAYGARDLAPFQGTSALVVLGVERTKDDLPGISAFRVRDAWNMKRGE
jgi:hypothetical protein